MKDFGLVSIITPNFNCSRYIAQTIRSVISQTYSHWELLIQDDCSTDNSIHIAQQYANKDSRIKIERNKINSGAAISRNNAIKRAKGEWLAFLDSDDIWLPHKLEMQLKYMRNLNADFSYTQYDHIDENGRPLYRRAKVTPHLSYQKMLFHCWTGCLTVMYHQDINNKIFGPNVKNCNDYALFLQVLKHSHSAIGISECTALYRIRKKSLSRNKLQKITPYICVLHQHEGISYLMSWFYMFSNLFIKTFFKYKNIHQNNSFSTIEI